MDSVSPDEHEALLQGPAATPPPGLTSNLTDPPNQRAASYFVIIFFGLLATSALVVRLYTRVIILRRVKVAECESTARSYEYLSNCCRFAHLWMGRTMFFLSLPHRPNCEQLTFVAYLVSGWLAVEAAPMVDQWNLRLENYMSLLFVRV